MVVVLLMESCKRDTELPSHLLNKGSPMTTNT